MIKKNVVANYIGRIYVIVTGIVVLPLYMQYLGDEAYGLVGLFTVVQSWLQLLNMGLAPTLGREAAKAGVSEAGFTGFYRVLASYELIFLALVIVMFVAALFGSEMLASDWLNVEVLPLEDVKLSIMLMFFAAAIRFQGSLYRSGIMGLEHQVFVNTLDIVFVSVRFWGGLALVALISSDVVHYFIYQFALSLLEIMVFRIKQFSEVPSQNKSAYRFYWNNVKLTLPFAGGVAYTSIVYVVNSQVDKVILSGLLTLREFGYYTLVALISTGIVQASQPIMDALRPKLTRLAETSDFSGLKHFYMNSTSLVSAVIASLVFIIAFNTEVLIFFWTGNTDAATWAGDVLFFFVLGSGIMAIGAFQYLLQFAYGKLNLHMLGATISVCVQAPAIAIGAYYDGALGAATSWLVVKALFFLFWVPVVHGRFLPRLHIVWLFRYVAPPIVLAFISAYVSSYWLFEPNVDRGVLFVQFCLKGLLTLVFALLGVEYIRKAAGSRLVKNSKR